MVIAGYLPGYLFFENNQVCIQDPQKSIIAKSKKIKLMSKICENSGNNV